MNFFLLFFSVFSFFTLEFNDFYNKSIKSFESETPIDLTSYLPSNYVKDGSIDYTSFIQRGINENKFIKFPNFPISINNNGLTIPNDRSLLFDVNSKLVLIPTNKERYEIIRIHNVKNVTVINPVIIGDKDNHLGVSGQWGMGISIRGSQNINISGGKILNCWGDGIYIGSIDNSISSSVKIKGVEINSNRRNGISITSGNKIMIDSVRILNTGGQAPESGIDIEPNSNRDIINNIELNNVFTQNNNRYGIIVSLNRLIGHRPKEINILIDNHIDNGSNIGFGMSSLNTGIKDNFKGKILIKDCLWQNNLKQPFYYTKHNYSLMVHFENVQAKEMGGKRIKNLVPVLRKIKGIQVD